MPSGTALTPSPVHSFRDESIQDPAAIDSAPRTPWPVAGCRPCRAQTATVEVEENFRAEPNGPVLGLLRPGATLPVVEQNDRWVEAELEGWVFIPSLQITTRGGFGLVISAPDGENIRAQPSGRVLARLESGTLLQEVERRPGWVRVRRRGWIWSPSVSMAAAEGNAAPGDATAADRLTDSPVESFLPGGSRSVAVLSRARRRHLGEDFAVYRPPALG